MKAALLIVLQLAASGSDLYCTHENSKSRYFQELNPIARPFMKTTASQAIYFGSGAALKIGGVIWLRKKHKHLADVAAVAGILDNAGAALYSATH